MNGEEAEEEALRDRARLRKRQMVCRLDTVVAGVLSSSSGNVPLGPLDLARDVSHNTMLHYCAWRGDAADVSRRFIEAGVDVRDRNCHGETCLHVAARVGNAAVLEVALRAASERLTSAQVADLVNKREWRCRMYTALHLATMAKSRPCVELLLSHGGNVGLLDAGGVSCAVIAANAKAIDLLRLLSREWYADDWRPQINQKWPSNFRREAFWLLLATRRVAGSNLYRDIRLLLVGCLANMYRDQRLRRGIRKRE